MSYCKKQKGGLKELCETLYPMSSSLLNPPVDQIYSSEEQKKRIQTFCGISNTPMQNFRLPAWADFVVQLVNYTRSICALEMKSGVKSLCHVGQVDT